jgi:hypothetical protein
MYELAKEIDDRARVNSLDGLEKMVQVFQKKFNSFVKDFEKGSLS